MKRKQMTSGSGKQQLNSKDFKRLSRLIFETSGINLGPVKKTMVESRLQKRMRALSLETHREYCDYLFSKDGLRDELQEMIDVITTNKTDFFREAHHFDFLWASGLPQLSSLAPKIRIWSAGCSTGEEPYSIAMLLEEYKLNVAPVDYSILATDISTKVLRHACQGIYDRGRISDLMTGYRLKYFNKSRDPQKQIVRVAPEVRSMVSYGYFNLIYDDMAELGRFEVIFCRNVIIYFDAATKMELLLRLRERLVPGGYLFLGHSESLHGMELGLEQVGLTIYRKPLATEFCL